MQCEMCCIEMNRTPNGIAAGRPEALTGGKPSKTVGWQCPKCKALTVHPWCPVFAKHETWRPKVSTKQWLKSKLTTPKEAA